MEETQLYPFQAIVLNEKLNTLNSVIKKKNKLSKIYLKRLSILEKFIKLPEIKKGEVHSFHQFVIICKKRNLLRKYLKKNKIDTMIHYPQMLSDMKIFSNTKDVRKIKFKKIWVNFKFTYISRSYSCRNRIYFKKNSKFLYLA